MNFSSHAGMESNAVVIVGSEESAGYLIHNRDDSFLGHYTKLRHRAVTRKRRPQ